ncbi:CHAD protein, partial [Polyodon spathula]|nr:CHAD protein [Polyodon spathula]
MWKISFLVTSLLALVASVSPAPSQCPSPCHCHSDLQHVICDNVGLKKIPEASDATRLLNLQRNQLPVIPSGAFSSLPGLISLHLQSCHIKEISGQAFKGLKKLIYLYLSNNEISIIKLGAFEDLSELTYLYLDSNRISDLPRGILAPMINLFTLQLNDNKIRELRAGSFSGAKDLRWLHISGNDMTSIQPSALEDVENLAILHLESNRLTSFPSAALSKLRVVEELKLSKNPMKSIPDNAFQSFGRYIEKLYLDNMGLERYRLRPRWPSQPAGATGPECRPTPQTKQAGRRDHRRPEFSDGAFNGVTALKSLHLENNKLNTLPSSLSFTTIQNMTIANNPWMCSCPLAPLRKWMDSSRLRPEGACAAPSQYRGQQVRDSTAFNGCRQKTKRAKKGARY